MLAKAFKNNDYLEKGIITGVLKVIKADMKSGLNDMKEFNMLN